MTEDVQRAIAVVTEAGFGQVTETVTRTWKIADGAIVFEEEDSFVRKLIQKKR